MFDGMSAAGSMFSGALDITKMKIAQEYGAQDRKSNQDFTVGMQTWHNQREDNAVQRRMADLERSGLNPILAAGGASQGAGSSGSGHSSTSQGSYNSGGSLARDYAAMEQASVMRSQADLNSANAEKARAEAKEAVERTPTHEVTRDSLRQSIEQSKAAAQELMTRSDSNVASAEQSRQHVVNMREQVDQIKSTVTLLRAQTQESLQRAGLSEAQAKEVLQRVQENLPSLERELMSLEAKFNQMSEGPHAAQVAHDESFVAMVGRVMKSLNPFAGIVGTVGRSREVIHRRAK